MSSQGRGRPIFRQPGCLQYFYSLYSVIQSVFCIFIAGSPGGQVRVLSIMNFNKASTSDHSVDRSSLYIVVGIKYNTDEVASRHPLVQLSFEILNKNGLDEYACSLLGDVSRGQVRGTATKNDNPFAAIPSDVILCCIPNKSSLRSAWFD
jgi:hypothetical protein